ncbi:MAG TPA: lipoate--protein ligase family protein [Rhabdochlamydiaceae bacterium]|nr:lipoate--protein ligase family protein [Rhabdochlamydiaceae bacterium]
MNLIHLNNTSIADQLRLEEHLLREDIRNFCLINTGSSPAIVMGISGKADALVHLDQLPNSIPLLRRFSGGGTVIVDENTVFVTFIRNKADHDFPAYPEPILRWAESVLAPATKGLKLRENDFVIGEKKCGGNALYIKKDRWLIHTSFLWDYDSHRMALLKHPAKTPKYREGRSHEDFICRLSDHLEDRTEWVAKLKNHLADQWGAQEVQLSK